MRLKATLMERLIVGRVAKRLYTRCFHLPELPNLVVQLVPGELLAFPLKRCVSLRKARTGELLSARRTDHIHSGNHRGNESSNSGKFRARG